MAQTHPSKTTPRKPLTLMNSLRLMKGRKRISGLVLLAVLFAAGGYMLIRLSSAAVGDNTISIEAESGQPSSGATAGTAAGASGGQAVTFNGNVSTETPAFDAEVLLSGLTNPWELKFLPGGEVLFTERPGRLSFLKDGVKTQVAAIADVKAGGEGGLMGLELDPQFAQNRNIYTCHNSTSGDIRIVRWRLADDLRSLQERKDIVTGITANSSGRHSGCRLTFGPDNYLWVGTGDAALGTQPQQPQSLNGKILRVDREGVAAPGNQGGSFDARIYSYGHRNTQGLAFFPSARNGVAGVSSEHGPGVDDEVNLLVKGNFGWAPGGPPYDEGVPMTDKGRFPDAISAIWSSGSPTQAVSGLTIINHPKWKGWNGAVAMAVQKNQHLKILRLDSQNKVTQEEKVLQNTYGRLRTVAQGLDGNLYLATDSGGNDRIIRLTARP